MGLNKLQVQEYCNYTISNILPKLSTTYYDDTKRSFNGSTFYNTGMSMINALDGSDFDLYLMLDFDDGVARNEIPLGVSNTALTNGRLWVKKDTSGNLTITLYDGTLTVNSACTGLYSAGAVNKHILNIRGESDVLKLFYYNGSALTEKTISVTNIAGWIGITATLKFYQGALNQSGTASNFHYGNQYGLVVKKGLLTDDQRLNLLNWMYNEKHISQSETISIKALSGQSNATGQGVAAELSEALKAQLANAYIINTEKFENIEAGVNTQSGSGEFGLEVNYGYLTAQDGDVFRIAKSAKDGEAIQYFIDNIKLVSNPFLQAIMSNRVNGYNTIFEEFLWFQGESDSLTEELANAYGGKLSTFMNSIQELIGYDFQQTTLMEIRGAGAYKAVVNSAIQSFVSLNPNARYILTNDLSGDITHLNATGLVDLGARIFNT